ncbi:hypothetical protein [Streptomyces cinereospinus]|uniref:hypothetical protein n=1 Tax=Streptomyces cinereospinus TaxID=285561 RepID=UPI003613EB38
MSEHLKEAAAGTYPAACAGMDDKSLRRLAREVLAEQPRSPSPAVDLGSVGQRRRPRHAAQHPAAARGILRPAAGLAAVNCRATGSVEAGYEAAKPDELLPPVPASADDEEPPAAA